MSTAGKAVSQKTTFSRTCSVTTNIRAKPEVIWGLLTNAADMPKWNSTIISVEGSIKPGETIKLKSVSNPKRIFNLKIAEFNPPTKLVWGDGTAPMFKGVRTYTLTAKPDGTTDFNMTEVISGILLLMIGGSLPDFKPTFEQYAADLKREAEKS
ncbi:MAG: SRPBCC domain-containing protein [Anaerolineaceae bacterium]|nr:SRPBCC domain-containing protein [Anaerolineaceae bacterium]